MKRRRMWLATAVASILVLAVGIFGGCSGNDADSEEGEAVQADESGTITSVLASREIPYYRDLAAGVEAEAQAQGWEVDLIFGDQTVPTQLDQVQTATVSQPEGLIVGPIDQDALVPAYREASEAGVPVVTVSDNIGPDGREYQLSYVGHDYEELGRRKAEFIVEELGGEGRVGMIHAIRGGNFTEEQDAGAKEVFSEHEGIEVIDGPYVGDFTPEAGLTGTENLLTRDSDLDAIYFDNDDIALGGLQAVTSRGIDPAEILIVGTDGGPEALEAVRSGEFDATFSLCGYAQGVEAVRTIIDYQNSGEAPPESIDTPQIMFTTANIDRELEGLTTEQCNSAVEEVQ